MKEFYGEGTRCIPFHRDSILWTVVEKEKEKKVTIEREFDPKKLVSYVNNPKFSLQEQRRDEAIDDQRSTF